MRETPSTIADFYKDQVNINDEYALLSEFNNYIMDFYASKLKNILALVYAYIVACCMTRISSEYTLTTMSMVLDYLQRSDITREKFFEEVNSVMKEKFNEKVKKCQKQ